LRPLSASLKQSLEEAVAEHEGNLHLASQYLRERGIDPDTSARFRLGVVSESSTLNPEMRGRLAIPSLGMGGGVYNIRFRALDGSAPKYLGISGFETRLFNVRAIHSAADFICITEGELDAVILEQCGYPAVGVCGANSWKRHHPRMFAGFQKVYVFGDGDDAGRKFAAQVSNTLLSAVRVNMNAGQDVTDLFMEQGAEGISALIEEDH
jgi:DNA primase